MATVGLYEAMMQYDAEHILYETGMLLKEGATDALESLWIQVSCTIAEHLMGMEAKLFVETLGLLDQVLRDKQIRICDAFLLSVQLSYLMRRVSSHAKDRPSIQRLREKVKGLFPEKAALSKDGLEAFANVLPSESQNEEFAFAQRIIAGLSKVWTEGNHVDSRNCMEYLTRRRLEIGEEGDMITFLWGVVHAFFKGEAAVSVAYRIFTWEETKKTRKERVGLLWSILYLVRSPSIGCTWRDDEERVLRRIAEKYKDLWKQLNERAAAADTNAAGVGTEGLDVLTAFEPRGTADMELYYEPYQDQRKNIDLKKVKGSGGGSTGVSKRSKEKDSDVSKIHWHAAYSLDTRNWGVHSSKERTGA